MISISLAYSNENATGNTDCQLPTSFLTVILSPVVRHTIMYTHNIPSVYLIVSADTVRIGIEYSEGMLGLDG